MNIFIFTFLWACGDKSQTDTSSNTATDTSETTEDTGIDQDSGVESEEDSGQTESQDADGDGFSSSEDCDDNNPSAYPSAMEFPGDGIDQDCDGADTPLNEAGRPANNPSFDTESNGVPADWNSQTDSWAWQANEGEIFNASGATGQIFASHSGAGAVKIWGDYGSAIFGNGESAATQDFQPTSSWNAVDKTFWIDAWVMHHDTDALQNQAEFYVGVRCIKEFFGTSETIEESFSDAISATSATNEWTRLWTNVTCPADTSFVQSVLLFKQNDSGTQSEDYGAVFVDDVHFGTL